MAKTYENFESLNTLFTSQEDEADDTDVDTGQGELADDGSAAQQGDSAEGDPPASEEPDEREHPGDGQDPAGGAEGSSESDPTEPEGEETSAGGATQLEALLQEAQELGLDVDGIQSEADLARKFKEQVASMQSEVLAARQQPPAQPPAPVKTDDELQAQAQEEGWSQEKYFSEKYGGPTWKQEFDNAMRQGMVVEGDAGYILAEGAPKTAETERIVGEMNASLQHRQHFYADLANGNFYEKTFDVYREPIEKMIEQRVQEALTARESENQTLGYVDQFERDNETWMYAKDPSTGQMAETPKRQEFIAAVREVQSLGVSDVEAAIKLAMKGFDTGVSAAPSEPPATEKPAEAVGTGESIENNQNIQTDQNAQQQSFLDRARSASGHTPSASGRDIEDAPQVLSEGDLDSLWLDSYRRSRSQ